MSVIASAASAVSRAACLSLGLGLFAVATPAMADVIYTFQQTTTTISTGGAPWIQPGPVPGVVTSGSFVLEQSIVRSPYSLRVDNGFSPIPSHDPGLVDISFLTTGPYPLTADLSDFATQARPSARIYSISLLGIAGSVIPSGEIKYNDTASDTRLIIDPDLDRDGTTTVRGFYNTDNGGSCSWSGACSFFGTLTATMVPNGATPVPEPASLALFGAGLLGLGVVRRRHWR